MTWKPIHTAPRSTGADYLPDAQAQYATLIAPVIRLRDAGGNEGLGMWSVESGVWRITDGDISEPTEWDGANNGELALPAEIWPFPDVPEPEGWRG